MDAYLEVFAKDRYVFAEIEARAELGDGCVALFDLLDGRWSEEPGAESVFAHASAREGEKLEEARFAEEIEIGGVEAGVDVDAVRLAGPVPMPAVFDAGEAFAIEVDGTFGAGSVAEDFCVEDGDGDEDCQGREEATKARMPRRWRENHAATRVAMTTRRRRLPKRMCSFSKCATRFSRACRRLLYSSDGERLDGCTGVIIAYLV